MLCRVQLLGVKLAVDRLIRDLLLGLEILVVEGFHVFGAELQGLQRRNPETAFSSPEAGVWRLEGWCVPFILAQ